MKKLHALAFYALVAPAITLGSAALHASHHSSENKDLGEQDMDQHAKSETTDPKLYEGATKSKYNAADTTGLTEQDDSDMDEKSAMQKKDGM